MASIHLLYSLHDSLALLCAFSGCWEGGRFLFSTSSFGHNGFFLILKKKELKYFLKGVNVKVVIWMDEWVDGGKSHWLQPWITEKDKASQSFGLMLCDYRLGRPEWRRLRTAGWLYLCKNLTWEEVEGSERKRNTSNVVLGKMPLRIRSCLGCPRVCA